VPRRGIRYRDPRTPSVRLGPMTLDMREACERCGAALAADGDAVICSYECTFCTSCGDALERVCPNCCGELVRRPRRG
jgi:uncharacterized protein